MMSDKELNPCPFDGGKAFYWLDSNYQDRHVIECEECGLQQRYEYSEEGVVDQWNTRAPITREQVNEWCKWEGMVVVPLEPTSAMLEVGHQNIDWCRTGQETHTNENETQTYGGSSSCKDDLIEAYHSMIKAADDS